ncbi:MAG TPA: shikimate dehydrogenase [Hyphomicrobiales bacterium]|nr:shikimate dehydrogenase [Hyphomicrobiales bacterium]
MASLPSIRLGLIGDNIKRSKSPLLHTLAGGMCGLDIRYDTLIPAELDCGFEAVFERCRSIGYRGINVTYPYKEKVVAFLDIDDPRVAAIGACNTVLFEAHGACGFNTDYSGFSAAFRAAFPDSNPGIVAMAGAGGVGKAIGFALADLDASALHLFDQDLSKAKALKNAFEDTAAETVVSIHETIEDAVAGADGLINCTPLGMIGHPGTAFPKSLLGLQRWAFDAVYTPVETEFLKNASGCGLEAISGYELFLHQGIDAFQIFTGRTVNIAALRKKLLEPIQI